MAGILSPEYHTATVLRLLHHSFLCALQAPKSAYRSFKCDRIDSFSYGVCYPALRLFQQTALLVQAFERTDACPLKHIFMVIKYDNSIKAHKSDVSIFSTIYRSNFSPPCLFVLSCLRLQINFQLKYDGWCVRWNLGVFILQV